MARFLVLLLGSLLLASLTQAQHALRGSFVDAQSGEALPIVAVIYDQEGHGFTSDLDGGFRIVTAKPILQLRASYVGYKDTTFIITPRLRTDSAVYYLTPRKLDIVEVIITAGDSAALALVQLALANRHRYDPALLPGYRFSAYTKLVGSLYKPVKADTLRPDTTRTKRAILPHERDSAGTRHYLFLNETLARRYYERPGTAFDSVISTRTSGLQRMMLPVVSNLLNSLTFYESELEILGQKYVNPFSSAGLRHYWYAMRDTLVEPMGDTVFSVYFWPRSNRVRDDLSGLLHIDAHGYALCGVAAWSRPKVEDSRGELVYATAASLGMSNQFRIAQRYQAHAVGAWFPKESRSEITLQGIDLRGESHISEIEVLAPGQLGGPKPLASIVLPSANDTAVSSRLARYRSAPLRDVERQTYQTIDSISGVFKLEDKVNFALTLTQGYVLWGPVRFDLLRLFDYNACEGYRLGLGVETSDRLSTTFRFGGYYAYGLRDGRHKYGGHFSLRLFPALDGWLDAHYAHDVHTPGHSLIGPVRASAFRSLYVRQMDYRDVYGLGLRGQIASTVRMAFGAQYQRYASPPAYAQGVTSFALSSEVRMAAYALVVPYVALHWDPYALLIGSPGGLRVVRTRAPRLSFLASQGIGLRASQALFTRVEVSAHQQFGSSIWGECDFDASAGAIWGLYPLGHGFVSEGGDARRYGLAFPRMLTTVGPGFFYHDYQALVAVQYTLPERLGLRITDSWRPTLCLQVTALWGGQWRAHAVPPGGLLRSAAKGFFEVGIGLANVLPGSLPGMGHSLSVRYRVGPHASPHWRENLSLTLSLRASMIWN